MTIKTTSKSQLNLARAVLLALALLLSNEAAQAQTTAFSYQGNLTDNGNPASGNYDFQFKLFDTSTVGTGIQQGATFPVSNLTVTAGTFTVQLDFGSTHFRELNASLRSHTVAKKASDPRLLIPDLRPLSSPTLDSGPRYHDRNYGVKG